MVEKALTTDPLASADLEGADDLGVGHLANVHGEQTGDTLEEHLLALADSEGFPIVVEDVPVEIVQDLEEFGGFEEVDKSEAVDGVYLPEFGIGDAHSLQDYLGLLEVLGGEACLPFFEVGQ